VRLHTNFPHHRAGVLRLLGCDGSREAVGRVLRDWEGLTFERAAAEAGMCVAAMRSQAEWDAHPQGRAVAALPPVAIERIGEAPPRPLPPLASRPLQGIRVLEATRVIAGPVCGRTLAAHGAEVLHISAAHLPSFDDLLPDTGRGKRTASLDLRSEAGRTTLRELVQGADVFVQGYRPGAVAAPTASLHFTPDLLAALTARGVRQAVVTLHVGAGTFLPLRAEDPRAHKLHAEWGEVTEAAAAAINAARPAGGRIVAIGTTALRLLETAALGGEDPLRPVRPFRGLTDIYLLPGHRFRAADLLMTNFHLPRSTLFMLVAAFAGTARMRVAYEHAIAAGYRFYSYGDGSLLHRAEDAP
jgi:hypothetical protein